jgi:hypothetical protein
MVRSLKINQRVKCANNFLGKGTVKSKAKGLPGYYNVLWDNPPKEYKGKKKFYITNKENLIKIRKERK